MAPEPLQASPNPVPASPGLPLPARGPRASLSLPLSHHPWTHPASPRGRHRRSSRSPLTPDTHRRFCRARGHTGPAPPHTWTLRGRGRVVSPPGAPARGQRPGKVLTEATAATINRWFYRPSTSGCPAWGAGGYIQRGTGPLAVSASECEPGEHLGPTPR